MENTQNRLVTLEEQPNKSILGQSKFAFTSSIQNSENRNSTLFSLKKGVLPPMQFKPKAPEPEIKKNNDKKSQKSVKSSKTIKSSKSLNQYNELQQTNIEKIPNISYTETKPLPIKPKNKINSEQDKQNNNNIRVNQSASKERKFKRVRINNQEGIKQQGSQNDNNSPRANKQFEESIIGLQSNIQRITARTRIYQKLDFQNIQNTSQFVHCPVTEGMTLKGKVSKSRTLIGSLSNVNFMFGQQSQLLVRAFRRNTPGFSASKHMIMLTNSQGVNEQQQALLQANYSGSHYNIYGSVSNRPFTSQNLPMDIDSNYQQQQPTKKSILATIHYNSPNCVSLNQLRDIEVYVRNPKTGAALMNQFNQQTQEPINLKELYQKYEANREKIIKLINKKPLWDQKSGQYKLHLHGLAKKSSVHNFVLERQNFGTEHTLKSDQNLDNEPFIMGKVQKDNYRISVKYPLSAKIAVGIVLSSLDFKWSCQ